MDSGFQPLDSKFFVSGTWIPDSLSYISDSKAEDSGFHKQTCLDSGFHKQKFPRLRRVFIKSRGPGIFTDYQESGPRLLLLENGRKIEPKEIRSRLIPCLLVVFTWQLEILATTLLRNPDSLFPYIKVLARRVSSRPVDTHFWKKYKENLLNLLKFYEKTCLLDRQFSMSG